MLINCQTEKQLEFQNCWFLFFFFFTISGGRIMNLYLAQISWLPSIVSQHRTEWLSVPCWTSRDRLSHVCSTNRATSSSGSNMQTFNRPKTHHCLSLPASLEMSFVFTYWGVSSVSISNVKICLGFPWNPLMWNGTNFGGVQEKLSASIIPRLDPKPPCGCKKTVFLNSTVQQKKLRVMWKEESTLWSRDREPMERNTLLPTTRLLRQREVKAKILHQSRERSLDFMNSLHVFFKNKQTSRHEEGKSTVSDCTP